MSNRKREADLPQKARDAFYPLKKRAVLGHAAAFGHRRKNLRGPSLIQTVFLLFTGVLTRGASVFISPETLKSRASFFLRALSSVLGVQCADGLILFGRCSGLLPCIACGRCFEERDPSEVGAFP